MTTLLNCDPFPKLLSYLLHEMLPEEGRDDVAQEVRITIWMKRGQCQGNFQAWYSRIVRNSVADWYRTNRRQERAVYLDGSPIIGDPTAHMAEVNDALAGVPRELLEYTLMDRGDPRRTPAVRARAYRMRRSLTVE